MDLIVTSQSAIVIVVIITPNIMMLVRRQLSQLWIAILMHFVPKFTLPKKLGVTPPRSTTKDVIAKNLTAWRSMKNFDGPLFISCRYCECFQGGVVCSEKCRCLECRNFTGSTYRQDAIQRANLKEKHGDGDPKNSHESSNNEDKASTEVQRLKTPTLQSKQRASIINEVNISIVCSITFFFSLKLP